MSGLTDDPLCEVILDCVYELDAVRDDAGAVVDFEFADLNEAGAAMMSCTRDELLGARICERFPINRTAGFFDRYVAVFEAGRSEVREFVIPPDQPAPGRYLHKVVPTATGVVIAMHDVTELGRARAALEESERRFRRVTELVSDWAYCVQVDGPRIELRWLTGRFEEITGHPARDHRLDALIHPDDRAIAERRARRMAASEHDVSELRIVRPDGGIVWVRDYGMPGEDGEIYGAAQDITAEVRAREEAESLRQQNLAMQRYEMLATAAAEVAHDFNNMLLPIVLSLQSAEMKLAADHPAREEVVEMREAARRASALVRDMLRLGARSRPNLEALDLAAVVQEAVPLVRASFRSAVQLELELDGPVPVRGDADQLQQLILNLVLNAADATAGTPGAITIGVREDASERGRFGRLTVVDRGPGMPADVRARMFDPFFTTKGSGASGLGLSVVRRIVERHDGTLEVDSAPGRGTRIEVRLPLVAGLPAEAVEAPTARRVLLVDDSELVRSAVQRALERAGYSVTVAGDGREALSRLEVDPGFDLVLSDEMMPNLRGTELLDRLRARGLEVPVILMSGYAETLEDHCAGLRPADGYLHKPVDLSVLLGELARCLAEA